MIRSALGMLSGNTRWIVSAHSPTFLWIAASVWLAIAWVLTTLVVLLFRAAPANTRVERIGVAVVGALVVLALGLTAFADIS